MRSSGRGDGLEVSEDAGDSAVTPNNSATVSRGARAKRATMRVSELREGHAARGDRETLGHFSVTQRSACSGWVVGDPVHEPAGPVSVHEGQLGVGGSDLADLSSARLLVDGELEDRPERVDRDSPLGVFGSPQRPRRIGPRRRIRVGLCLEEPSSGLENVDLAQELLSRLAQLFVAELFELLRAEGDIGRRPARRAPGFLVHGEALLVLGFDHFDAGLVPGLDGRRLVVRLRGAIHRATSLRRSRRKVTSPQDARGQEGFDLLAPSASVTYAVAPWRVAGELVYGALVDEDRPRLLARRSEFAYTDVPALSLPGEPEAISESEQRRQTLAARRKRDQQQRQTWLEARAGSSRA
jgi:hypothetical protein